MAEAQKITKRYKDKLRSKHMMATGYVVGKILQGDGSEAARGLADARRLTKKERLELEKAQTVLKSEVIDD